jgi:hypothetical protein
MDMFDYLLTALGYVAGLGMFCVFIVVVVKLIELFLNQFEDRDPWK